MKKMGWCARYLAAALLMHGPFTWAQTDSPVASDVTKEDGNLALVNGQPISRGAFDQALTERLGMGLKDGPDLRQAVRRDLVIQSVLSQLAQKLNLDKTPAVELRLATARQQVLAQAWQQQWIDANKPTAAEIEAEYQAVKTRSGDKEYQIRQVVVRDETAAKRNRLTMPGLS